MSEHDTPHKSSSAAVHFEKDEQVALNALLKYNPDAKNPQVFNVIPRFLGGTLCLVEHGEEDQYGDGEEWCVLVKNGRGTVYYDYEQVLQEVVGSRSLIAEVFSSNVILAVLSVVIVLAAIVIYATQRTVEEPFRGALTAVLGFWFGKSLPTQ
jgi:hypothetical protein